MSKKTYTHLFTVGFIVFVCFIIYSANTGKNLIFFRLFGNIPMGDKIAHFSLIGILTFLVNASLKNQSFYLFQISVLAGSMIVFCLITIEEFSQIWISRRNFDLIDLACNYLGISIASYFNNRNNK